jgi:predicted MPP superfamily phosphohydrolase
LLHELKIELVGFEYYFSNARERVFQALDKINEKQNKLNQLEKNNTMNHLEQYIRLSLIHHPGHASFVTQKQSIQGVKRKFHLLFSGHLHGGQFTLQRFLNSNQVSTLWNLFKIPDYDWYSIIFESNKSSIRKIKTPSSIQKNDQNENHSSLLYVLSGTGFYGLPLRIGTQNELPIITIKY